MSGDVYVRVPDVVWRVGTDRVLVHRVWPAEGRADAADLLGLAAMVWAVLDEPGDAEAVIARLVEHRTDGALDDVDVRAALAELATSGWITATT